MLYANPNGRLVTSPDPRAIRVPTLPQRHAPEVLAHCDQCGRDTGTVYLLLRSGLVGNCCCECRRCRRFKPYAPRHVLTDTTHDAAPAAQGDHHAASQH